jgi:RNA ligase (TIGR02306 family)
MERRLATIRTVSGLTPIPDADQIELARIDGWGAVVKKGEFKAGDSCVYFEVDSFLPVEPRYEFLRKSSYKKLPARDGFRLRTCKFRGQLSQGLALPLSAFPEITVFDLDGGINDVSELLNVIKYEPPIPAELAGEVVGPFPSFIPKTDAERIQNLPELFTNPGIRERVFELSIKLNGTSCTIFRTDPSEQCSLDTPAGELPAAVLKETHFGVCSRNYELKESESNTYWKVAKELGLDKDFRLAGYALQGELIGPGIQKNPEKLSKPEFRVFNVYEIGRGCYLNPLERSEFLVEYLAEHQIAQVPILGHIQLFRVAPTMEQMLALASGPSLNPLVEREGIVAKAHYEPHEQSYEEPTFQFKVISNDYLLKNE